MEEIQRKQAGFIDFNGDYLDLALRGSFVISVAQVLMIAFLSPNSYSLIACGVFFIFIVCAFSVKKKFGTNPVISRRLSIAYCLSMNILFVPVMFLTSGSVDSGIPLLYIFFFALTFLLLEKKTLYITVVFEIISYVIAFGVCYLIPVVPDSFVVLGDYTYIHIPWSTIIVGFSLGMIIRKLLRNLEDKQISSAKLALQLQDYSNKDALSLAYNRRFLHSYLEECIRRVDNDEIKTFSIIMFDLDHFKSINDQFGHLAGDEVIKTLSTTISSCLRSVDVVSRYGGEEFICVLPTADETPTFRRAEQIRQKVESTQMSKDIDRVITISGGVAGYTKGMSPEDIIKTADENLYIAKETGRNQIVWHSGGIPPLCYNAYEENSVLDMGSKRRFSDVLKF